MSHLGFAQFMVNWDFILEKKPSTLLTPYSIVVELVRILGFHQSEHGSSPDNENIKSSSCCILYAKSLIIDKYKTSNLVVIESTCSRLQWWPPIPNIELESIIHVQKCKPYYVTWAFKVWFYHKYLIKSSLL